MIDTGVPGGLYEPEMLQELDRLRFEIANLAREPIVISEAASILDIVEETHQALNENRPEMRRIPETREAVAQELLLFENSGSDDTEGTRGLGVSEGATDHCGFPSSMHSCSLN